METFFGGRRKPRAGGEERGRVAHGRGGGKAASMTDGKIAEHVGVAEPTVAKYREEVAQTASSKSFRTETKGKGRRVGKDNKSYPAKKPRKKKAAERAKEAKPAGKTGRPPSLPKGTNPVPLSKGGNDRLTARIARDRPDVLERMKAGEFRSVRAAAIEAGIVKPETPATRLRKACRRSRMRWSSPEGRKTPPLP